MNKEILIKYFNGSISEEEEKFLLDWIDASEANRREFFQERKLWDILLLNNAPEVLHQKQGKSSNFLIYQKSKGLIKIAAVFLVAFLVSLLFIKKFPNESQAWNTIEVPVGQRTCLHLADGTTVWLNAKTKFSFPDKFRKNIREVKLDGEAVFNVSHHEKAPFIVKTQEYNVRVLGTEFNVYAYANSHIFETSLIKGKVLLENNTTKEDPVELRPNQMAIFNGQNKLLEIKTVDTKESIYWIEGVYSFNNQSLSSIIQRLERYYEVTIDVRDSAILESMFTGKFRYNDPIEVILKVIQKSTPFKYIKNENKIAIYN